MQDIDPEKSLERINAQMERKPEERPKARLEPTTPIEVDCEGSRGDVYKATFFFQVPRIGDQFKITTLKTTFLPLGSGADRSGAQLADMVAYLTVCITFSAHYPKPDWWAPAEAYDPTPYQDLFRRCLDYEDRFHGRDADGAADADGSPKAGEPARDDQDALGDKVQPATKRRETLAGDGA